METMWSWVQPLHSTMASSELRDFYEVYNREVRIFGIELKILVLVVLATYH